MIAGVAALTDSVVAVMVAVPGPAAVTVTVAPLNVLSELAELTVNTAVLLETQVTVRPSRLTFPASFGVAVRDCVPPTVIGMVGADSVSEVTGCGLTVIKTLEVIPPADALMVAEPALRPARLPV
jgi:hypothetical protein